MNTEAIVEQQPNAEYALQFGYPCLQQFKEGRSDEARIALAERNYQRCARGMVHRRDGMVDVTEEMSSIDHIRWLDEAARSIAVKDELFIEVAHKDGVRYKLTPAGKQVWFLCQECLPYMNKLYPDYVFNPFITVMLRACRKWAPLLKEHSAYHQLYLSKRGARVALRSIVRFVRRVCRSRKFKYILSNYERNQKKNFQSSCRYLAAIFESHAKVLVLRIDLYYRPDHKGWANTLQALIGLKKFMRALREDRVVPDVLGWVCKRESGFRRGVHYHLMVALDGHEHRDAANLSKRIGEYWVNHCTGQEPKGSYFNCYTRQKEYQFNGLGLVHISDRQKLIGIREALRYITKGDYQLKTGLARNLWRGIMPKQKVKRGAPRKAGHDMSLVEKILGGV